MPPRLPGGRRDTHHADRRSQTALTSPSSPRINPHTLSTHAQRALESARVEAVRLDHDAIGAEHILLGLLRGDGNIPELLHRLGLDVAQVEKRLESSVRRGSGSRKPGDQLAYTSHAKRLIEAASKQARESGTGLSAEHLLLAALREPRGTLTRILADAGVSASRAQSEVNRAFRAEPKSHDHSGTVPRGKRR